MSFCARTPDDVRRDVLRRAHRGEPRKAIAIDTGLSWDLVCKLTAHLPHDERPREARRKAILAALDRGETYPPAIAREAYATVSEVVRISRALAEEQRLFPEGVT